MNSRFCSVIVSISTLGLFFFITESLHAEVYPSPPSVVNHNATTDLAGDSGPKLTTDRSGNWVATWFSSENLGGVVNSDDDIVVATSIDNGETWSAPSTLNSNAQSDSGKDSYADVATDRAGTWVAVWM